MMRASLGLLLILGLVGCSADNSRYCKDDSTCTDKSWEHYDANKPHCHGDGHFCYEGCKTDADCDQPGKSWYMASRLKCDPTTSDCVASLSDGGPDSGDGGVGKQKGEDCVSDGNCESGLFCVDDVCCAADKCSECMACNVDSFKGDCQNVPVDQPHAGSCVGTATGGVCDGVCDGAGGCKYPGSEKTGCDKTTCTAGEETIWACDGSGGCQSSPNNCGGFTCDGDACRTSCTSATSATDCVDKFFCNASNTCEGQLPNGDPCGTNNDACATKFCVDGYCCGEASCGTCMACDVAGSLGTCTNVPAGPAPTGDCPGDAECGGETCDGNGACDYKALNATCKPSVCTVDQIVHNQCDAANLCVALTAVSCPGFTVCDTASACKTGCAGHADCITGSVCDRENAHGTGKGVCVNPSTIEPATAGGNISATIAGTTKPVVKVPAGNYTTAVVIGKNVKVIGIGAAKIDPVADGAAVTVQEGKTVLLQGLTIQGATGTSGHGVQCFSSGAATKVTLVENTISDNKAVGVNGFQCDVTLRRNTIQGNDGGGAKLSEGTFEVVNNVVTGNGTGVGATMGGFSLDPSQVAGNVFVNNTVAYNGWSMMSSGSAVQCQSGSAFDLYNSIFWGNGNGTNPVDNCTPKYSDFDGGLSPNIDVDPQFMKLTPPPPDFSLKTGSPCTDKGSDSITGITLPAIDRAGNPRSVDKIAGGAKIDMGAFEVQ